MNRRKFMIVFLSFIILFVFTILFLSNSSFAIFKRSNSGSGTLSAATWSVSASSNSNSLNVEAGGSATSYTLTVTNNSDVDVDYAIVLANLPNGMQAKLDSGSYVTESGNSITFSNVGSLSYSNPKTRNHTITLNAPSSVSEVSNWPIYTRVVFEQAHSGN